MILGRAQWAVADPDPIPHLDLLWLWCRPAAAALIPSVAWEFPHAMGGVLKRRKKKKVHNVKGSSFVGGKTKIMALETAFQTALRNCLEK